MEKIVELLKANGFKQSIIPNEFTNGRTDKMILGKNGIIFHAHYTPNYGRYLWSYEYKNFTELEKYLKNNH